VTSQAEIVFRREWGRAVAVVARLTGDLGLAEDAVQEAFAAAVGRWATGPLPSDPSGWLITVAKNHALCMPAGRIYCASWGAPPRPATLTGPRSPSTHHPPSVSSSPGAWGKLNS
jgi:Sigma-70 region 2